MAAWEDIVWSFAPYVKQPVDVWRDIPCRIYQNTNQSHKFMLASASPVFYSMFDGQTAEKGAISTPDIAADVFNDILT